MTEPQPPGPNDTPSTGQPPAPDPAAGQAPVPPSSAPVPPASGPVPPASAPAAPVPPAAAPHGPVGADGWELPPVPQAGAWDQGREVGPWTNVTPEAWEKLPPSMRAHLTQMMEAEAAAQGVPLPAWWPGSPQPGASAQPASFGQAAPSVQPAPSGQPTWPPSQPPQAAPPLPPQAAFGQTAPPPPSSGWAPPPQQGAWAGPAGQPGWAGAPGQPGWPTQGVARRSRRPFVIGCLILLVLIVVGIGGCIAALAGSVAPAASVVAASDGQIDTFSAQSVDGRLSIIFTAAPRVNASAGPTLACGVIVPTLQSSGAGNAEWVLLDTSGEVLASSHVTVCP